MNTKNFILLKISSIIVAAAMIILLSLYFIVFNGGLSTQSSDWGNFGDFVGGISMLLLTSLNVLIFYQLTKQMCEENNFNANKQQKIEALVIHSELQKFLYSHIIETSESIIRGGENLDKSIEHVKHLYAFLKWADFTKVFSEDCEKKRKEICAIIQPIIGIDENGKNIAAAKQEDNEAWNALRANLIMLEVFVNQAMMNMVESLTSAPDRE